MPELKSEEIELGIRQAADQQTLRQLREMFQEQFRQHLTAPSITAQVKEINAIHDAFIRRAVQLAETELYEEGQGEPPVPYSFVLFGSGGRSEQTLWSDQDNGLIYEPGETRDRERIDKYFERLSARIREALETLGYPPCEGNVICTNARWRKPLADWLMMLEEWLEEPHFEHIRYVLITADARSVWGDEGLVRRLKDRLFAYTHEKPEILQSMVNNTLRRKVLLGPFGNLLKERYGEDTGSIDIKYGSYIPMVNGIRMLAIRESLHATNTLERIAALRDKGVIESNLLDDWTDAFVYSLWLRLMTPAQTEGKLFTTSGKLKVSLLDRDQIAELKRVLRIGQHLQRYVQRHGARRK